MRRRYLVLGAGLVLGVAAWRIPSAGAGQAAVSHSRPGHEDLTFWVNHNGLDQVDVEGPLGFGDWARLLMRRRSNGPRVKAIRDRFVFKLREFAKLDTPDLLRPGNPPYVIAQNRVFNLLDPSGRAYRVFETQPGRATRTFDGIEATFDVRPLVRLRVNLRDERNRPARARVYLTAADGLGYAPKGAISRFTSESAEPYFHADGSFEMELPAGQTTIEAARGVEYELARHVLDLRRPAEVTLKLKRWIDMAARGWYSSDAHIHANYTAEHHQVVTPADVRLYTLGEDLHNANMMVANSSGAFLHDTAYFEGKPSALTRPPYYIYWNEEMRNAGSYGHMCLYNLKRLVEPLYTGFRDTPHWEDWPANYTQAKAAREQGGAVTYAHPGYAPTFDGASARELPVDLALGQVDAMDVLSNNPEEVAMELWYRLLNCGLRLAISAGTDAFTNVADHYAPGGGRVYAHVPELSYPNWIASYKRGRSFASNGPMLFLTVNGREPGDEIRLPAGRQEVRIQLEVKSQVALDKTELIVNGQAVSPVPKTLALRRSSWIAARATGPWHRLILNDAYAFAHTSPVYVYLGDQPIESREDARFWVEWIDKLIQRTEERGRFAAPERKREVMELFRKARAIYARQAG